MNDWMNGRGLHFMGPAWETNVLCHPVEERNIGDHIYVSSTKHVLSVCLLKETNYPKLLYSIIDQKYSCFNDLRGWHKRESYLLMTNEKSNLQISRTIRLLPLLTSPAWKTQRLAGHVWDILGLSLASRAAQTGWQATGVYGGEGRVSLIPQVLGADQPPKGG